MYSSLVFLNLRFIFYGVLISFYTYAIRYLRILYIEEELFIMFMLYLHKFWCSVYREKDLDEVLQSRTVYSNVSKGVLANSSDLRKAFGNAKHNEEEKIDHEQICLEKKIDHDQICLEVCHSSFNLLH